MLTIPIRITCLQSPLALVGGYFTGNKSQSDMIFKKCTNIYIYFCLNFKSKCVCHSFSVFCTIVLVLAHPVGLVCVCVCLGAHPYVCGAAADGWCGHGGGGGGSGWRVVCFWLCVLSVRCVSAVSQGNAWLPIQAAADPAVPS